MAQTQVTAGSLEAMEALPHPAAQPACAGHARASGPRVGRFAEGTLADRRFLCPFPRPTEYLLDEPGPYRIHPFPPPFPGCNANRRMRTRMSGGVGGAGVSPAPTRLCVTRP